MLDRISRLAALGAALGMLGGAAPAGAAFQCPTIAAPGDCGDGGPALRAGLSRPADVAARPGGGYVIADAGNDAVRLVNASGRIHTLAGGLRTPSGVAVAPDGATLVAESAGDRVVALGADGRARTLAGGAHGFGGDGGPATRARLSWPLAVAVTPAGTVVIADTGNNRVRAVGRDGTISTLARLDGPVDVAALPDGRIAVATADGRVRLIEADGTIATLAAGLDGAPGIAATAAGDLVVTEPRAHRVLRIDAGGGRATLAAGGRCGTPALLRAAGAAGLGYPAGAAVTPGGDVLVADAGAQRIVRIAGGAVRADAGAGLLVPDSACRGARTERGLLAAPAPPPLSSDAQYNGPPGCNERAYWTFNLAYQFATPSSPRVRRPFSLTFTSSKPVRVRLSARSGRISRTVPARGEAVTHHARFTLKFARGLPRAGRYSLRLSARSGNRRQCLKLAIRVRR